MPNNHSRTKGVAEEGGTPALWQQDAIKMRAEGHNYSEITRSLQESFDPSIHIGTIRTFLKSPAAQDLIEEIRMDAWDGVIGRTAHASELMVDQVISLMNSEDPKMVVEGIKLNRQLWLDSIQQEMRQKFRDMERRYKQAMGEAE